MSPARPPGGAVYVSNHESGSIAGYTLASDTGRLTPLPDVVAGKMVMPLAADPRGRFLHALLRSPPYAVQTYAIDASTGALRLLASTPMPESMVNATVDRSGRWLLSAAYGANALCVQAIHSDGHVEERPAHWLASGGIKPHAVCLDASNRHAYVHGDGD